MYDKVCQNGGAVRRRFLTVWKKPEVGSQPPPPQQGEGIGDQECPLPQSGDSQNLTLTPERTKNCKVAALPATKWNKNLK